MRACGLRQERYSAKRRGEGRRLKPVYAAVNVEIVKTDEWEAAIPGDKRKTRHIDEEVFETDDPRWLAFLHALHELHEAESEAECALADIVPTTMAGVCALLKYGAEVEVHGAWNDLVDPDDESAFYRRVGRSWHYFVNRNLVECLEGLARSA